MSGSPYPLVTRPPLLADENPLVLTIRGAESVDAIGDKAGISAVGANAGKFGFGSAGISEFTPRRETLQLGYGANSVDGAGRNAAKVVGFQDGNIATASANGGGGGTGGKLRSVRRGNKKTPYDRPTTGRHATAGGSASMAPTSLTGSKSTLATFKDTASQFLHFSVSSLFSALFKRQPASITANGETSAVPGASIADKEEPIAATVEVPVREENDKDDELASQVPALEDASENPIKSMNAHGSALGIEQVEEILQQRMWSREQVKRMTEIMNSRVSENDPAGPVSEAEKLEDQLPMSTKVSSPVQMARAYMGDQSTRPSGIAASIRKSTLFSTEVQHSPGRMPMEDRYMSSPFSRHWGQNPPSVRVPKRSLVMDDDLALIHPARRIRQKTTLHTSSSPYSGASRRSIGSSKPLESRGLSPPSQSSQTALKILETLEKLSPSPQGKFLEGPRPHESDKLSPLTKGKSVKEPGGGVEMPASNQTPMSSKSREKQIQNLEFPPPKLSEAAIGGMVHADTEAMKNLGAEFPCTSQSPIPALAKGFRMNAVFEESNSDDEAKLQKTKPPPPAEASNLALPSKGKEDAVSSTAAAASVAALRESTQPNSLPASSSYKNPNLTISTSTFTPLEKGKPSVTSSIHGTTSNLTSYPSLSFPPVQQVEAKSPPLDTALPHPAADGSVLFEKVSSDMAECPSLSVFAVAPQRLEKLAVSGPATLPLSPIASAVGIRESTEVSLGTTSRFPVPAPELKATAQSTSAAVMTHAMPFFAKESGGPLGVPWSPVTSTATGADLSDAENAVTMATESPVAEKPAEVDTMATDAMAEEPVTTAVASSSLGLGSTTSSTSTFSFGGSVQPMAFSFVPGLVTSSSVTPFPNGGQSGVASASTSSATQFTFGGVASAGQTAASFSFGGQTGTQASSFAAPTFGVQSGSMGQLSSFGALPSTPFPSSQNSSSPFVFGSSSTSNPFALAPSGLFGAPNMASPFSSPATGNSSSSAFSTTITPASAPPTLSISATPSGTASSRPPTFLFGATAQPNSFAANSFSSSSSAPAFSFGASATTATMSSTLFGSTASSTSMFALNVGSTTTVNSFSFGSASTSKPSPFAFGSGQSATAQAPPAMAPFTFGGQASGQAFAFGGQQPAAAATAPVGNPFSAAAVAPAGNPFSATPTAPAGNPFSAGSAPVGNPFSAAGATQSGSAGFALGASGGGDKSGRKFIKAKRIGGAKRSK